MKTNNLMEFRRNKETVAVNPYDLKIAGPVYPLALDYALKRLSGVERMAILLRFQEAMPIARVADAMNLSWGGADNLIDRAVSKVRSILKGSAFEFNSKTESEKFYEQVI